MTPSQLPVCEEQSGKNAAVCWWWVWEKGWGTKYIFAPGTLFLCYTSAYSHEYKYTYIAVERLSHTHTCTLISPNCTSRRAQQWRRHLGTQPQSRIQLFLPILPLKQCFSECGLGSVCKVYCLMLLISTNMLMCWHLSFVLLCQKAQVESAFMSCLSCNLIKCIFYELVGLCAITWPGRSVSAALKEPRMPDCLILIRGFIEPWICSSLSFW